MKSNSNQVDKETAMRSKKVEEIIAKNQVTEPDKEKTAYPVAAAPDNELA